MEMCGILGQWQCFYRVCHDPDYCPGIAYNMPEDSTQRGFNRFGGLQDQRVPAGGFSVPSDGTPTAVIQSSLKWLSGDVFESGPCGPKLLKSGCKTVQSLKTCERVRQ